MTIPERFSRNIGVLSENEQTILLSSRVAVVGLGCTGCTVTEFLARAGVGRFILADGDAFEESNLNRQLYARKQTLGQNKALAAREAVLQINPTAEVTAHGVFLTRENANSLLARADLVVSGVDDAFSMILLHRTAKELGKNSVFVLSGCLPFQGACSVLPANGAVDYETFMGLSTKGCSLDDEPTIKALLFEQITKNRARSALKRGALPGLWFERRMGGGFLPSFGVTSNMVAMIAAYEAVKVLIGRATLPPVVAPRLIFLDGATCHMEVKAPPDGQFWFQGDF